MIKRTLALSAVAAIIGALSMPVIAASAPGAPGQVKDKGTGETGKNHAPGQLKNKALGETGKNFAPGQLKCDVGFVLDLEGECVLLPSAS